GFVPEPSDDRAPTPDELAAMEKDVLQSGYGIARVERLPGNVGYLDLRGFGPAEFTGEAYTAALSLLAGTDAMIVDLRHNGGGDPSAVAYFMSHFFATGDRRHLNDIYSRPTDRTDQFWTVPVKVHYTRPVYVLTSKHTFSGGEECAYDFQTQKRATLVGETTGGGANPGDMVALVDDFVVFIPTGRAINPITRTNWEHVGVKPDVPMDAAQAKQYAYATILRAQVAAAKDPEARDELTHLLERAEKGDVN
ncbi:MAG: S41 family peptidase, partial [Proteobacteria bacterium]|nr:S41 family peptidase [Pseudomonadota bacterium]